MERKLTAILCADVYGYSRLMGQNEEATLSVLTSYRKVIDSLIEQHRGRFVNSAGDSVLAEFASVTEAVNCAVEVQTALKASNANLPAEQQMHFRIGVNLGDVMVEGEQIYGDGVNVAARLENLADPGGICISGTVHEQVRDRLTFGYEDRGEQTVKNIARPVHVWRVVLDGAPAPRPGARQRWQTHWRGSAMSLAGVAIAVVTFVLVQHVSLKPRHTSASIPPQEKLLPLPNIPSIAVLPFTNLSGDPQQEYFSDGITDDLTTALSRLPNLFVIARTSAFTYKNTAIKVQDVSRELGVKYVLEGTVRKTIEEVRITAQLVDATTGGNIWAQHFDRPPREIFSLEDDVVEHIATTLNLQMSLMQQGIDVRQGTNNIEAYDTFLRAIVYGWELTKDSDAKAEHLLEKAIQLDPGYADAYATLGVMNFLDWLWQWSKDPEALDHSFELERKAIALDDSQPVAHAMLGRLLPYKGQYDQAIAECQRSLAIAPNLAYDYVWIAETLTLAGKPAEAIEIAEKAMRVDPKRRDFYLTQLGLAYYLMGRDKEAIPFYQQHLIAFPNNVGARLGLAASYAELGRQAEARNEAAVVMRLSPQFSVEALKPTVPLKDPAQLDRMLSDLHKAALR